MAAPLSRLSTNIISQRKHVFLNVELMASSIRAWLRISWWAVSSVSETVFHCILNSQRKECTKEAARRIGLATEQTDIGREGFTANVSLTLPNWMPHWSWTSPTGIITRSRFLCWNWSVQILFEPKSPGEHYRSRWHPTKRLLISPISL